MALISPPTAQQVFDKAKLDPSLFGLEEDSEVMSFINGLILTDLIRSVNMKVDSAARPYDFPLDDATLALAYPSRTEAELAETRDSQSAELKAAILDLAVAKLFLSVRQRGTNTGAGDFFLNKSNEFKKWGEAQLENALQAIRDTVALTPLGSESQESQEMNLITISVGSDSSDEYAQ